MGARGVLRTLEGGHVSFHCPGCNEAHVVKVEGSPAWGFNGDFDRPTFTPSVLLQGERWEPPVTGENIDLWRRAPWEQKPVRTVCHSFVTDGQIQFLSDCTHGLAGKTVPLAPADDLA